MPWSTLQALENTRLATDALTHIDYSRLPTDDGDAWGDSQKMYAVILRAFYGQVAEEDQEIDFADAAHGLAITKPALRHFVRRSDIIEHPEGDRLAMNALVSVLPKASVITVAPKSYISSAMLTELSHRFGTTRQQLAGIVMKLAYLSPYKTVFGRQATNRLGDIYFPRNYIMPHVRHLVDKSRM